MHCFEGPRNALLPSQLLVEETCVVVSTDTHCRVFDKQQNLTLFLHWQDFMCSAAKALMLEVPSAVARRL